MLVARIDKDRINIEPGTSFNRTGKEFKITRSYATELFGSDMVEIPYFRCKDDDGIVYYEGWLYNDNQGEVQQEVLRWCQNDAGCTTIEIKKGGKWVQEIG